jgi:hypothetical protein
VHAGCADAFLLERGREDIVAGRRKKRQLPVGLIDAT